MKRNLDFEYQSEHNTSWYGERKQKKEKNSSSFAFSPANHGSNRSYLSAKSDDEAEKTRAKSFILFLIRVRIRCYLVFTCNLLFACGLIFFRLFVSYLLLQRTSTHYYPLVCSYELKLEYFGGFLLHSSWTKKDVFLPRFVSKFDSSSNC